MARNGSGVYALPAGYEAVTGETILATQHNTPLEDLAADANLVRPVVAGGTGESTIIAAADALSTKGSAIASAATTDIGAATGRFVHITGTTTITGLGTKTAGVVRILQFDGILTLTHNATSLILPGVANITTAAGDIAVMVSEGSGNWRCVSYQRSSGGIVTSADKAQQESASSTTAPITPSVQQHHPSAAKAWARVTESGGSYSLAAAYNIDSITKNSTGNVTVTFDTDFSSANYVCVASAQDAGAFVSLASPLAGSVVVNIVDTTPAAYDDGFYLVAFGDQ